MVNQRLMAYKDYATRYGISTVHQGTDPRSKNYRKTMNELLNDIYEYEKKKRPADALYPFFSSS
jgi:hypothetical protein